MKHGGYMLIGLLLGVVLGVSGMYIIDGEVAPSEFPEPDGVVIIDGQKWRFYEVNDARPPARCWVSKRGVLYEDTGVRFPSLEPADEATDVQ